MMNTFGGAQPARSDGRRTGRPFDRSSDELILASTLDLLAERDFERVTVDEVAARTGKAKTTLYRRWATKEELVLAAIRTVGRPPEADKLPDFGALRADLLAVVDSPWLGGPQRRLAIFAGLSAAARSSESLAAVIRSEVTEPYVEVYRRLVRRAIDRGEVSADLTAHVAVFAEVIPAMSSHRMNSTREPVRRDFFVSVIDDVLLPALRVLGSSSSGSS